ncbi:FecR domain-containing protein [Polyangium jinanense]|uniref:FecR domain-containing protein n=1 Tax=Polyangium jinanense TaxID=2829994 RepID=A0A9X4AV64_9BACT|nr:FecR domain-containing protein [Polyangium jinanense]MDC3959100.1 FecR domain-containing protein [Polyangium jinanense]MDC3983977.1 FecR domain-containing protein [Polyangium jinanense]
MSDNDPGTRALEVMRDALADEKLPELPWDAIEQKLEARIAEDEQARASRALPRIGRGARVGLALCAAAAAVIAVASFGARSKNDAPAGFAVRWRAPETIAFLAGSESERDLSLLRPGDGVEAGEAPLTLVQRGIVRVTLAPGARATVVAAASEAGDALVLGLERGSLRADVTPRKTAEGLVETFAVDVGRTRVAAHGTAFTVVRGNDDVFVDLEHGAVAVGPAGRPGVTTGRLLVGRARASFSLDGGETARMLAVDDAPPAPPAPVETTPPPKPAIAPPPPSVAERPHLHAPDRPDAPPVPPAPAPTPSVEPEAPPAPKPAPVLTRASVQAGLSGCFETHYRGGDPSVRLSVAATVTVSLDPEGAVSSVRFDPPLEPQFMQCVFNSLRPGKFLGTTGPLAVPFQLGQ